MLDLRNHLTRQQQKVLLAVLFLVLTGLAVKVWRTAHPEPIVGGGTTRELQKP